MVKCVVEDDERHFFGRVLLVVNFELCDCNLLYEFIASAALVDEWSFLKNLTIFVYNVLLHIVGKLELCKDLLLLKVVELSELVLSNAIENIVEGLFILVVNQFINESTLALVAPQSNHE
jgi:hypothetical protein